MVTEITFDPNPFVYSRPVPADEVIDRDKETAELVQLADAGHFVRIAAPRRYGKTSLMAKVFDVADKQAEMTTILVDLFRAQSLADVAIRLERSYAQHLKGQIRDKVGKFLDGSGLGLSLGPVGISLTLATRTPEAALPLVHTMLDLPRTAMAGSPHRALIVFDEFQDVMNIEGFDGLLRSHIQHHGDVASYFFMGSAPSLMRSLFEERTRPLFEQAEPFHLGRLDDADIAAYVVRRFEDTGRSIGEIINRLVAIVEGHPQRAMLMAHRLWQEVPRDKAADADAWQRALAKAREQVGEQFSAVWQRLTSTEKKALRGVASLGSATSMAAQKELDIAPATAHAAVERLIDAGDLERTQRGIQFVDPLFRMWVAEAAAAV